MNFARPLIPSAIVTCWVSSRTRPMPRRHSMLGTRNTRRPGILCHWSTVTMIKVYQSLNKILVTSEKLIAKWWNMGCKLGKFFESCGFTFDFLVEDGQDHLVTWTWISPFPKQLQFLRTPTPENLLSQKESNLPTIIFRGHVKHQACNIYIYIEIVCFIDVRLVLMWRKTWRIGPSSKRRNLQRTGTHVFQGDWIRATSWGIYLFCAFGLNQP